jgi:pseudouridine-5'-phosphate glycosidase
VPATIGVVGGRPTVGLSPADIERLAPADTAVKLSLRDLPVAAAKGLSGGTTVAATAFLASRAGVRVFSTGGLGGVHRDAQQTFDESADLPTLAALPLVVVSAGVKSILDIPLTLERLETLNLTVVGYRTTDYPGFYVADSGFDVEYSVDSAAEIADIATARDALGISSTLLVANPVDAQHQLPAELHDDVLARALAAAAAEGVSGHDTTPFLLDFMQRETGGRSLDVNVEVYRGNVSLGAEIAAALAARA